MTVNPELLEGIRLYTLAGVRDSTDGDPVELRRDSETGRLMIVAWNECHNNVTRIDLFDLIEWFVPALPIVASRAGSLFQRDTAQSDGNDPETDRPRAGTGTYHYWPWRPR